MMQLITPADIRVLALTIHGEGRGESDLGKLAIGWTVRNRAEKHDLSLAEACLKSIHYSAWNNARSNDANQLSMMTAELSDKAYARCMVAALQVAHELEPDPTGGATHYVTLNLTPEWAKKDGQELPYDSLGNHKFYRGIK